MKWLLWREAKLNRLILITGIVLLLIPYFSTILIRLIVDDYDPYQSGRFRHNIGESAVFSLVLSQLTLALLGCVAFAGERADRSAEFIEYLPIKRTQRLASKLCLSFIVLVIIWGVNLLICFFIKTIDPKEIVSLLTIAVTGFTIFGVSWLISSFQSSPTLAIGGGIVTPLIIAMSYVIFFDLSTRQDNGALITEAYLFTCLPIIPISFGIGTAYYLQRKEP